MIFVLGVWKIVAICGVSLLIPLPMYLIYFSGTYKDFRLPELNSLLELFGYNKEDVYSP